MRSTRAVVTGLVLVALAGACRETGDDGIGIDATGRVEGLAWLDRNGNGELEGSDGPAADVRVHLLPPSGDEVVYSAVANAAGAFTFPSVVVGDYRAAVDTGSVGDTLRVLRVDPANLTVGAGDTVFVGVGITYPTASVDSVRSASLDRRYFVEGRVISEWDTFGDGTIHIRDETGALRALRVQVNNAALGDLVRLLGTTSVQAGRAVLKDVLVFIVETGVESPDPVAATTAQAASADGGRLDADLVRVVDAVIQDTLRNSFNEPVLRVDDGSGALDIVLDRDIPLFIEFPPDSVIGVTLEVAGLLLPPASGAADMWVLKPRQSPDIVVQ